MTYTKEQQKANRQKWVAALREPGRKQIKKQLENSVGQCCLGVACYLAWEEGLVARVEKSNSTGWFSSYYDNEYVVLPAAVIDWLGMTDEEGRFWDDAEATSLARRNDEGATFARIADIIESEPEGLLA